jgi:hypothetical protein
MSFITYGCVLFNPHRTALSSLRSNPSMSIVPPVPTSAQKLTDSTIIDVVSIDTGGRFLASGGRFLASGGRFLASRELASGGRFLASGGRFLASGTRMLEEEAESDFDFDSSCSSNLDCYSNQCNAGICLDFCLIDSDCDSSLCLNSICVDRPVMKNDKVAAAAPVDSVQATSEFDSTPIIVVGAIASISVIAVMMAFALRNRNVDAAYVTLV